MKIAFSRNKGPFRIGFLAGLAAGVVASVAMLFIYVTWNGVSLPDVFGSELVTLMPLSLFDYLHQLIGEDAKTILFYGVLVGQCLVFALSGAFYYRFMNARQAQGDRLLWHHGLMLAAILWLFAGGILLPLTNAGFFGASLDAGIGVGMLSLGIVGVIFGLVFVYVANWLAASLIVVDAGAINQASTRREELLAEEQDGTVSRRTLLKRGLVTAGIVLAGAGIWRFITSGASASKVPVAQLLKNYKSKIVPPPTPNYGEIQPAPFLSPEIVPNDQFYLVSKNLSGDPTVDGSSWSLRVDGEVERPFTLNYQQLMSQPMQQQYESLMCISNDVGGPYMGNAKWEGIQLAALLQRAGVKSGATKVVFHAADDYSDSIHLSKALEPTTLLAVRMNGVALPQEHGFPVRMLVPGIYGMKHCKWLNHIEVVNYNFLGYWQQLGWNDLANVRLTSRIDTPLDGGNVLANRTTYIAGVAFSGNKGISEVDVSLDSGQTWQRAVLKQPGSDLTWVIWEYAWKPTTRSNVIITVRAIDMEGNVQDPNIAPPLPNGSSGYHSISTIVS
ncbi:MAG TPA: molybdopterin-dependent oxidoreductase [Ktedonobacteraceae bacterium]|nr:molybdopterin-dependent oxidoreductase [Ktedonobacteraceae bacterium]